MKSSRLRRVTLNIHTNGHEVLAASILAKAQRWRCHRLLVFVEPNGNLAFADVAHAGRAVEPASADIIGVFGADSDLSVIEDAVLEQKRQMTAHLQVAA
ncbi:hypothetical protein [Pseudoxanthomonas winnipegensis]|uniref:Uncharacterized protein n=1 Tax=Pseudoxanthomonas winnipegensis TaxID=2480810 RepID=A0A4Q8LXN3_9GAMM|nr:hypothetical protein [Pseudoxanthomonas winnipegensis]RZZ90643.1 hypothetical protein EA663_02495 [Pseudoxanthomonas winnipegensis]TAA37202.1 hypothetical protein EA656_00545 [Pseudoxanthomonas winnipegensis]